MSDQPYLTSEGAERLRKELAHLKGPDREAMAKRLRDAASRRSYLGEDGLGCFLDGRYAKEDSIAGMLGYVQQDSVQGQARRVADTLEAAPENYALVAEGQWREVAIVRELSTFRSIHSRRRPLGPITLLHTFLLFC